MHDTFIQTFLSGIHSPAFLLLLTPILMCANGLTNIPSSQVLYITLGIILADIDRFFWILVGAGACGNAIGNLLLTILIRRKGESFATRYTNIEEKTIRLWGSRAEKYGLPALFVIKLIPGVKVLAPLCAALTKRSPLSLFSVFFVSSYIWATLFVGLGVTLRSADAILPFYSKVSIASVFLFVCIIVFFSRNKMSHLKK